VQSETHIQKGNANSEAKCSTRMIGATSSGQPTTGEKSAGKDAGDPECLPEALYLGSSLHSDTQPPLMTGGCQSLMVHSNTKVK
jgi:hypothetical protein